MESKSDIVIFKVNKLMYRVAAVTPTTIVGMSIRKFMTDAFGRCQQKEINTGQDLYRAKSTI